MEGLRIVACLCSFVSLLLLLIALASDYWTVRSDGTHTGLWKVCIRNICASYGMDVLDFIHGTRAFLFMAMVAGAVSFIDLCASFYRTHIGSDSVNGFAAPASFVASLCSMIAMSAFTGVYHHRFSFLGSCFGWSFGIGWASCLLFLITGGLALMLSSEPGNYS